MASDPVTSNAVATDESPGNWKAGLVGGLLGSAAFGVLLSVMMPEVLEVAIPSMYGLFPPASGLAGWALHVSHGAILGVVFAAIARVVGLDGHSARTQVGVGIGYGVVLWVVLAAVLMPVWLSTVGSPANPPLPNVDSLSLIGHAVYGALLGATYYALEEL